MKSEQREVIFIDGYPLNCQLTRFDIRYRDTTFVLTFVKMENEKWFYEVKVHGDAVSTGVLSSDNNLPDMYNAELLVVDFLLNIYPTQEPKIKFGKNY